MAIICNFFRSLCPSHRPDTKELLQAKIRLLECQTDVTDMIAKAKLRKEQAEIDLADLNLLEGQIKGISDRSVLSEYAIDLMIRVEAYVRGKRDDFGSGLGRSTLPLGLLGASGLSRSSSLLKRDKAISKEASALKDAINGEKYASKAQGTLNQFWNSNRGECIARAIMASGLSDLGQVIKAIPECGFDAELAGQIEAVAGQLAKVT